MEIDSLSGLKVAAISKLLVEIDRFLFHVKYLFVRSLRSTFFHALLSHRRANFDSES
jgi:hypothetical protein